MLAADISDRAVTLQSGQHDLQLLLRHISFATYLALAHFSELDWQLVGVLCNYPGEVIEIARKLYEQEQVLEAEALLHAVLPHGKRSSAAWAAPIRERWKQVRASMRAYEREYITTSMAEVQQIAHSAFRKSEKFASVTDEDIWEFFYANAAPQHYQPTPGYMRIARAGRSGALEEDRVG